MARKRVWITRTQPGAQATAARLTALGYEPVVRPLLRVQTLANAMDAAPAASALACIALTSPNTLLAMGDGTAPYASLPAYAVGDTTARAAKDAGFIDVRSAAGDIHALAALIRQDAPMGPVFAPGAARPAGNLPALLDDRSVLRLPVYETVDTFEPVPSDIDAVMIHSPRAGQALANALQATPSLPMIVAISSAAARPFVHLSHLQISIADHPDEEAMIRALGNSASAV